jgi:prepilin-type N-terminal cleavage/methylation domain-containing protein
MDYRSFSAFRGWKMTRNGQYDLPAFTLVELMIVLVILGIVAAVAVPLYTSTASIQLKTAANMIASDLEYAKSMAMSTGRSFSVVFDDSTLVEGYRIKDANGQVIPHPVHIGADYIVSFANDSRLNKVNIESATFGSTSTVKFDYMGAPYDGSNNPLNSGSVLLRAEGNPMTVRVEPVTGYISIE